MVSNELYERMIVVVTNHYIDEDDGLLERGLRANKRLCLGDSRLINRFDAMLLWEAVGCVDRDEELNNLYKRLSELKSRHAIKKAA